MHLSPAINDSDESDSNDKGTKCSQHGLIFDSTECKVAWDSIPDHLSENSMFWIEGIVEMVFTMKQKASCVLSTGDRYRQRLEISIKCRDWSLFDFKMRQKVQLGLKGATLEVKRSSAGGYMPFSLVFNEGASARFVGDDDMASGGKVIDTWTAPKMYDGDGDWFSTPHPQQDPPQKNGLDEADESDVRTISNEANDNPEPTPSLAKTASPSPTPVPVSQNTNTHTSRGASVETTGTERVKHEQSKRGSNSKKKRKLVLDNADSEAAKSSSSRQKTKRVKKKDTRYEGKKSTPVATIESSEAPEPTLGANSRSRTDEPERTRSSDRTSPSPSQAIFKRNPALDMVPGLSSKAGAYPGLSSINAGMLTHVIGVVAWIEEPQQTKNGQYKLSLTLIDPSKFLNGRGFKITCFMRQEDRHILPSPSEGHVLLLRNVKTSDWHGNINGTVYPDKLKWVAYDPATGKTYFPEEALHPQFDTFHKPDPLESTYFVKLGEWWRATKEEEEKGTVSIETFERTRREHRLIKDCVCNQFFDATVEIVKRYEDYEQTVFLLSDYTPHPLRSTTGTYGQWAVTANTGKIAEERLNIMTVGTFQYLKNVRLKLNGVSDLELDLYAAECTELDPNEDANDIHLQALLKRKEAYLVDHPLAEDRTHSHGNEITSISDIIGPGNYNIFAELIFRYSGRDNVYDLFLSDYTENSLLSDSKPPVLKRMLDKRSNIPLLHIAVWEGHEFVRQLKLGNIYIVQDVRITSDPSGALRGNLKLPEQRITKVNIRDNTNPRFLELLQRKEEFEKSVDAQDTIASGDDSQTSPSPQENTSPLICLARDPRHQDQPVSTIKDLLQDVKRPNKFRLQARIVDFYPLEISDFTARWCRSCRRPIQDNRNACTLCDDIDAEHVAWVYRFFFLVEDKAGDRIVVDCCSEGAELLSGIEPCELGNNRTQLMAIKKRLRSLLGNLVEVHEGIKRQEVISPEYIPYLDLAVKSWEITEDDDTKIPVYSLTGCIAPDP